VYVDNISNVHLFTPTQLPCAEFTIWDVKNMPSILIHVYSSSPPIATQSGDEGGGGEGGSFLGKVEVSTIDLHQVMRAGNVCAFCTVVKSVCVASSNVPASCVLMCLPRTACISI